MSTVVDRTQAYLIQQGIGRDPRTSSGLPPVWRQPVDGTPAPGEGFGNAIGPTVVIGLLQTSQVPSRRFEKEWQRVILDIWYRTTTWPLAITTYSLVRNALIDKVNWSMAGLPVIESQEWRGHDMIASSSGQGYSSMSSVIFEVYTVNIS